MKSKMTNVIVSEHGGTMSMFQQSGELIVNLTQAEKNQKLLATLKQQLQSKDITHSNDRLMSLSNKLQVIGEQAEKYGEAIEIDEILNELLDLANGYASLLTVITKAVQ